MNKICCEYGLIISLFLLGVVAIFYFLSVWDARKK